VIPASELPRCDHCSSWVPHGARGTTTYSSHQHIVSDLSDKDGRNIRSVSFKVLGLTIVNSSQLDAIHLQCLVLVKGEFRTNQHC
jgi:hypothetical protein